MSFRLKKKKKKRAKNIPLLLQSVSIHKETHIEICEQRSIIEVDASVLACMHAVPLSVACSFMHQMYVHAVESFCLDKIVLLNGGSSLTFVNILPPMPLHFSLPHTFVCRMSSYVYGGWVTGWLLSFHISNAIHGGKTP